MLSTNVEKKIPQKQRFTVQEVAEMAQVPIKTVYGWHYYGRYDGIKIGGARFFSRQTVIEILGGEDN